jgi:hypothetical protein
MKTTALKIVRSFTAFGRDYSAGEIIDPSEDTKNWPKNIRSEALKRRLEGGDIEFALPELSLDDEETPTDEAPAAPADGTPAGKGARAFQLPT